MTDVGRISSGNEAIRSEAIGRAAGRADRDARPGETSGIERGQDSVDVSDTARVAASRYASEDNAIRQDLVDRIRAEIESGSYETPIKIAGTVDGLLDALS
ncbi:MAG: flagellar biosynthesis anti-sigma factor FlgM [Phycisphaerales bacterium]|nr:flagellar biosynthesis anti-sigma factor FlgM [Phycisphaerales bacterium]MCB9837290.1 flagellar biosynthesis anti-sigma factor FlgM [Phycisphaera sp.]